MLHVTTCCHIQVGTICIIQSLESTCYYMLLHAGRCDQHGSLAVIQFNTIAKITIQLPAVYFQVTIRGRLTKVIWKHLLPF